MRKVQQEHRCTKTQPYADNDVNHQTNFFYWRKEFRQVLSSLHFQRFDKIATKKACKQQKAQSFGRHILNGGFPEQDWSNFALLNFDFSTAISWKRLGPPKLCLKPLIFFLFPLSYSSSLQIVAARYKFINTYAKIIDQNSQVTQ